MSNANHPPTALRGARGAQGARSRVASLAVGSMIALAASGAAFAQADPLTPPYSADIEFVRPTFGHGSFHGLDVPMTRKAMTFRYGILAQYERDPLTLYNRVDEEEDGAIVSNRINANLGVSVDLSQRFTLHLMLPLAVNSGTEVTDFGADGFGLGDIGAGARVVAIKTRRDLFNLGARAGLILPTGRKETYIGDQGVRANAGLLAAVNLGPVRLATDAGIMARQPLETLEDFTLGNEVTWGNGARIALPDATRTAFTGQILSRAGLSNFLQGGAENSMEAMAGIQVLPSRSVTVDLMGGRGLTQGYGTTDLRILSAVVIESAPREEVVLVVNEGPPPPPPPPPPVIEDIPEPEPEWKEGEVAKVVADRIVIKDMLEFVVDTNILLEKSRPTLLGVANVINTNATIGAVVIEGHASQEGNFEHNYKLSESRARAIWEQLFQAGVHPSRIAYRGMGEVVPIVLGEDEASLQANRRVEFKIVKQYDTPEEMPDYDTNFLLPWNGEQVVITLPEKPKVEEPKETGPKLDEFGLPIDPNAEIDIPSAPEGGAEGTDAGSEEGDEKKEQP